MRRSGPSPSHRQGIAVFLVVMIAAIVGVFVVIVMFHGSASRRTTAVKVEKSQAEFVAKGAQQHFLLKFKLLPTELYDAVSYAAGKNPYFDFSLEGASVTPPNGISATTTLDKGPMFFTGTPGRTRIGTSGGSLTVDRAQEGESLFENAAAGFTGDRKANRRIMEVLLNHYLLDIATNYPTGDPRDSVVVVSTEPHLELARFGLADRGSTGPFDPGANPPIEGWRDPFDGSYFVQDIRVLGSGGAKAGRKYQADSVLLITEATVRRSGQLSLVTVNGSEPQEIRIQREVERSLKTSRDGWVDLKESFESQDAYTRRIARDQESGARTEIATGIYFISRGTK